MWRMRYACWITKAADTHSEYVILITFTRSIGRGKFRQKHNYNMAKIMLL